LPHFPELLIGKRACFPYLRLYGLEGEWCKAGAISGVHFSLAAEETLVSFPLSGREAVVAALPTAQASAGAKDQQKCVFTRQVSPTRLTGIVISRYSEN
jgi:hypothetical protein